MLVEKGLEGRAQGGGEVFVQAPQVVATERFFCPDLSSLKPSPLHAGGLEAAGTGVFGYGSVCEADLRSWRRQRTSSSA